MSGNLNYLPSILDELVPPKPLHPIASQNLLCQVTNKLLSIVDEVSNPFYVTACTLLIDR